MIRRIALCYLFLAALLLVYADIQQHDEQIINNWSQK